MPRLTKRISKTAGLSPGALVYVGEKREGPVSVSVINYDESSFEEKDFKDISECFKYKDTPSVSWININGVHNVEIIEAVGNAFGLHPLGMEDIINTGQRPKYEDYDNNLLIVFKMLQCLNNSDIVSEQVSVFLGENFVVSFQEKEGDVFEQVRNRIRNNKGRIRKMGADYLAYCLLDSVVDGYYAVLEKIGDKIESIEEEVVLNPEPKTLQIIHNLKREAIYLRKSVWPLREVINSL
ncbi:MAG: magnesium and cobalt transport protein CorA, partial [Candidatus Omnitrophota bacterium]